MKRIIVSIAAVTVAAYGNAALIYFIDDATKLLRTVDTNTLVTTTIGPTGITGNFGDMAWDRTTGTMYVVGGRSDNNLYRLNLATGAATLVGAHNVVDMFCLGVDGAGNLFGQSTNGNVYSINKSTGAAASIGSNQVYPGSYMYDVLSNRMLLLEAGGSGGIYSVNLANGAATVLATPGWVNDNGFTHDPGTNEFFAMDWSTNLYKYDAAFNRTLLGSFFGSVASIEIVPEPASLAILGAGLLGLLGRRRRKAN